MRKVIFSFVLLMCLSLCFCVYAGNDNENDDYFLVNDYIIDVVVNEDFSYDVSERFSLDFGKEKIINSYRNINLNPKVNIQKNGKMIKKKYYNDVSDIWSKNKFGL